MKKDVNKAKMKVYGMGDDQQCKVVLMMLKDRDIPYDYIDLEDDDFYRDRLAKLVGNFSVPKMEYGDNILDYSVSNMEKIFQDYS